MASCSRLVFVSCCLAESIQAMYIGSSIDKEGERGTSGSRYGLL
jgi:hypothetical protein